MLTARGLSRQETRSLLSAGNHGIYSADLANDESVATLADSLPELDGLVLNAGMVKTVPVRFVTREILDSLFNANLNGSVLLLQRLLRLKKSGREHLYALSPQFHPDMRSWAIRLQRDKRRSQFLCPFTGTRM